MRALSPERLQKPLKISFISLAFIVLGFSLVVYIAYAVNLMNFPFDYDQGEGFELVDTILFSEFEFPYRNTDTFPFYSSNYPPVYHVIVAPFVWIFGNAYWYGRLVSFLTTIITSLAIMWVVKQETKHHWIAILAGLAFIASNTIYHIGPLFRQHISMVMFETLGVIMLARAYPQRNKRNIFLGLVLLLCAGYTKQLAAFSVIAIFLWMFIRNPRRSIVWGIGFATTAGLIFIWINFATNGEWWRQAIVANVNEFRPLQMFGLFLLWFKLHGFLLIPAFGMVLYDLYRDRISAYSMWFVITTLMGGVSSGKWGAGDSYFATAIAAMCILCGLFFSKMMAGEFKISRAIAPMLVAGLFIGYGIATLKLPTDFGIFKTVADTFNIQPNVTENFFDSASFDVEGYANIGYFVSEADIEAGKKITALIEALPAEVPVLSEEAGFSIAANRPVITNPTQLLNLWHVNEFNGDELIHMIEAKQFGLIILRAQFYPTPVLEAIGRHYSITDSIRMNQFDYLILEPIELTTVRR